MKNKFITVYKIIDINSEYQKPAYPSLNENEKIKPSGRKITNDITEK